jgi:Fe-S cluster biogenesis protein NfuA
MSVEIKIQAQIVSEETCQFTIDRPVYADGSVYFADHKDATGSPLAEKLFEIPEVSAILVSENVIKVTKHDKDDWLPVAKQVGSIIRNLLQSGETLISKSIGENLPSEEEIKMQVQHLLMNEINPAVASHGGFVRLIDVKKNNIYLQLGGGCQGCGLANVTLRQGIEMLIRKEIPYIGNILDVTDHASGTNPYYSH